LRLATRKRKKKKKISDTSGGASVYPQRKEDELVERILQGAIVIFRKKRRGCGYVLLARNLAYTGEKIMVSVDLHVSKGRFKGVESSRYSERKRSRGESSRSNSIFAPTSFQMAPIPNESKWRLINRGVNRKKLPGRTSSQTCFLGRKRPSRR